MNRTLAAIVLAAAAIPAFAYDGEPWQGLVNVVESPKTLALCGLADVTTTVYAVHTGIAHEANPLLAPSVNAHHFLPLLLSKLAIVGAIWFIYERFKESEVAKAGVGVATVVTCGVAANNAAIILKAIH